VNPRPLLTDRQCRLFLNDLIEFGYTHLTFEEVREIADKVHAGTHDYSDVVTRVMLDQIDEAIEMRRRLNR
jgi:hypothetical protein